MVKKLRHAAKNLVGFTYIKTILREIKQSFTRFIAIFAIVALGVGFLAGLMSGTPDMENSVDTYYDENKMMDIFIKSNFGFTAEDLKAVAETAGVEEVLPAYVMDYVVTTDGNESLVARIYGQDLFFSDAETGIDSLTLLEGRMPEQADECLVERSGGNLVEIGIGTIIAISSENEDYQDISDTFAVQEYTVVGIVSNPLYISTENEPSATGTGYIGAILYIDESCYALDVYTDLYLRILGAEALPAFSDTYDTYIENYMEELKTIGKERSLYRYTDVLNDAIQEVQEAEIEYTQNKEEAEIELSDSLNELNEASDEIESSKTQLAAAKKELAKGEQSLADERTLYEAEVSTAQAEITDGFSQVNTALAALEENKKMLDSIAPEIEAAEEALAMGATLDSETLEKIQQYHAALDVYNESYAQLTAQLDQLNAAQTSLDAQEEAAEASFAAADAELDAARAKIKSGQASITEAEDELAEGMESFVTARLEAEAEFLEAGTKINAAKQDIADMEYAEWYVLDHNSNVSYVSFSRNVEKVAAVTNVFPFFFLLVAALVTLTTMTRMIQEERAQIGTLKALGYTKGAIIAKYLIYCSLAGILGSIAGSLAGFQLLPAVIWNAYASMYHLPDLLTSLSWNFILISTLLVLASTIIATVSVCYYTLREKPASLMLPRAPKAGKRIFLEKITPLWKRLSFSYKSTARNIVRYKKHLFMTIIGIAGCAALMLAAFGLKDSMNDIVSTQFNDIFQYDLSIEVLEKDAFDTVLQNFLSDETQVENYIRISSEEGRIIAGASDTVTVIVPEDMAQLGTFIHLVKRESRETMDPSICQVAMSEKLAEVMHLTPGDTFSLENADGKEAVFTLDFVTENYVGAYVYVSRDAYTAAFGETPSYDRILVKTYAEKKEEKERVLSNILNSTSVSKAEFISETKKSYDNLMHSMVFVIMVIIVAAGSLAMIVLYNLINVNIEERRRELATLKVLGYHTKEIAAYIFREIAILCILGTAVGLVLGVFLHSYIVQAVEDINIMFGRNISWLSFLYSGGATLFFSAIVDLFMIKKLKKIKITESLKAID